MPGFIRKEKGRDEEKGRTRKMTGYVWPYAEFEIQHLQKSSSDFWHDSNVLIPTKRVE
jgi:hypothetical protein